MEEGKGTHEEKQVLGRAGDIRPKASDLRLTRGAEVQVLYRLKKCT